MDGRLSNSLSSPAASARKMGIGGRDECWSKDPSLVRLATDPDPLPNQVECRGGIAGALGKNLVLPKGV